MITEEIIKEAQSGNSEAFTKIYNETIKTAYYVAKHILIEVDSDVVEDVLQDAYVAVYKHLGDYKAGNFQGWVDTIVANRAKNYLRKKNPTLFSDMETEENPVVEFEDEKIEFRPDENVDYTETKRLVMEIVDSLPADQRLSTILFYFEQRSVKEIAEICECSENTVKSRLNYARKKIKEDVLALEKKGTKLYSISAIPFLIWLLSEEAKACVVSEATSTAVLTGIQSATGSVAETVAGEAVKEGTKAVAEEFANEAGKETAKAVAKEVTSEAGKETVKAVAQTVAKEVATEAAKATATAAVKTVAVKTGMALGTKIAIAVTAATVTVGGVAGATAVVQNYEEWFEQDDDDEDDDRDSDSENNNEDDTGLVGDVDTEGLESGEKQISYRLKKVLRYFDEKSYQDGVINETIIYNYQEDGISFVTENIDSDGDKNEALSQIYDEKGRLIEICRLGDYQYFFYNEDGQLYKSEYIYGEMSPETTLYEYDSNGYLIKETSYNSEGYAAEVKTYTNDAEGKALHVQSKWSDVDEYSYIVYAYDEAGRVVKEERYNESGYHFQEIFQYDDNGNLVQKEQQEYGALTKREVMEYDHAGNLKSKIETYFSNGEPGTVQRYFYEYEEIIIEGHVHNYTSKETKAPTCEADGQGEITYTCSCGDTYTEETDRIDHCTDDVEIIQEATCSQVGIKTYSCIFCGREFEREEIPKTEHIESDWIIVKEATDTEDGLQHKICTVCGEEIETEVIPSTGN